VRHTNVCHVHVCHAHWQIKEFFDKETRARARARARAGDEGHAGGPGAFGAGAHTGGGLHSPYTNPCSCRAETPARPSSSHEESTTKFMTSGEDNGEQSTRAFSLPHAHMPHAHAQRESGEHDRMLQEHAHSRQARVWRSACCTSSSTCSTSSAPTPRSITCTQRTQDCETATEHSDSMCLPHCVCLP
jgi:hypothetical protein